MRLLEGWHAVVRKHEKGFWMGDLFDGEADMPEAFFTMSVGGSRDAAVAKAQEKWPYAELHVCVPCDCCDNGLDEDGDGCSICDGEGEVAVPYLSTL